MTPRSLGDRARNVDSTPVSTLRGIHLQFPASASTGATSPRSDSLGSCLKASPPQCFELPRWHPSSLGRTCSPVRGAGAAGVPSVVPGHWNVQKDARTERRMWCDVEVEPRRWQRMHGESLRSAGSAPPTPPGDMLTFGMMRRDMALAGVSGYSELHCTDTWDDASFTDLSRRSAQMSRRSADARRDMVLAGVSGYSDLLYADTWDDASFSSGFSPMRARHRRPGSKCLRPTSKGSVGSLASMTGFQSPPLGLCLPPLPESTRL